MDQVARPLNAALMCRICLNDDKPEAMIAPCKCSGSQMWVHRFCLDEWRAQERVPLSLTHCCVCKGAYVIDTAKELVQMGHKVKFGLLVSRDVFLFFFVMQTTIAGLGIVLHAVDRGINCPGESWNIPCNDVRDVNGTVVDHGTFITDLYPNEWADATSVSRLSLGPYYVSAFILLLGCLGVLGLVLWCTGRLPSAKAPSVSRRWKKQVSGKGGEHAAPDIRGKSGHLVRRRKERKTQTKQSATDTERCECNCSHVDCGYCDCYDACFWLHVCDDPEATGGCMSCDCCSNCGAPCAEGGDCGSCGDCGGGDGGGEAAALLLLAALALAIVFVLIGVVVGIFFTTIIFQRIVQSHFHLIAMRAEAKKFVVKDMATPEEHAEAEAQRPPAPFDSSAATASSVVTTTTTTTTAHIAPVPMAMDGALVV